jgi:hypothetical protein
MPVPNEAEQTRKPTMMKLKQCREEESEGR